MVVIVGSGAGGGLLAMELATSGIPVTILVLIIMMPLMRVLIY